MRGDFGYFEEEHLGKPYDLKLLKRLYPFARPYAKLFGGVILLVVLITLLELARPMVIRHAVDTYIVPVHQSDLVRDNSQKTRYVAVDLSQDAAAAVVARYPNLFSIDGQTGYIRYEDLAQLTPGDNKTLRSNDLAGVVRMALLFIILILSGFALNFWQVMILEVAGQRIMHDLRITLYRHIQRLSITFFTRNPVGRLVTRVTNDIQNMNELFTSIITVLFKDIFIFIGIAVVLLGINTQLALVSFTVLPLVVAASMLFAGRARDVFRNLRIKIAEINTRFAETIAGIRVIQLFGKQTHNLNEFRRLNHANYLAGMQQIHIFAIFMPIIELLSAATVAAVIWYGGREILAEHLSLGDLVAFISYMRMFFRPIRDIAEKYNIMQNAMASAERIFQILDNPDLENTAHPLHAKTTKTMSEADNSAPSLGRLESIEFDQVDLEYITGEAVLKNISFRLKVGETIAVVGPTGSGKTSLINLIARFYTPTAGQVRINGIDSRDLPPQTIRSKLALVAQDPFLFSETVRDNLFDPGINFTPEQIRQVLELANCAPLIEKLPQGLDTHLSEGATSLSSGERQLLSIARALARDADLTILDEATSYVDSQTETKIQQALHNVMRFRTSIVIAHRLSTARNADRILVLNHGRIIESGSHTELLQQKGFYYRLNQVAA